MSGNQEDSAFIVTLDSNGVQQEMLMATLLKSSSDKAKGADRGSNPYTTSYVNPDSILLTPWASSSPFQTKFEEELYRISNLVNKHQVDLELSSKALFARAYDLSKHSKVRDLQEEYSELHQLKMATRKTVDDAIVLQEFFTKSRNLLLEIASRAERIEKHPERSTWCTSLVNEIMPKVLLNSSLVCVISDTYSALRHAEEKILNVNNDGSGGDALWEAPSSFKRSTTKYWVKDEHLTKLLMICAAEAPLLVYGKKGPLTSLKSSDMKVSDGDKLWDALATRITSIYFDSKDMKLYNSRLKRDEGAQLLRARWYGSSMPTGDKHIFLELKTHHEKWIAQKSVKERATILERHMVDFLRPNPWNISYAEQLILEARPKLKTDAVELSKQAGLLLRMHNLVVKHKLTACVRSVYDRAAFQSSKSNDLRLTLDRNVTLINEREAAASYGGWCLSDSAAQIAQAKVVPFNVFETKLADNKPMPTGLANAETDQTMVLATKFSKFLTGAAAFNAVTVLPYWAADASFCYFFDLHKRGVGNDDDAHQGDYTLMDSALNERPPLLAGIPKLPQGLVIAVKNPARVDPTTYFANERTFVQWISASILLLSVSGFLLNSGHDYGTTAAMIALTALVLVLYSSSLFFQRLSLLKNREPNGYFNKINPIFLSCVTGIAIFLVLANAMKGSEFLGKGKGRQLFQSMMIPPRLLQGLSSSPTCPPQEVFRTNLSIHDKANSLVVDHERHAFLMTSKDSIYIQSQSFALDTTSAKLLIRINQSHLHGIARVGDRLFTVSNGPECPELIAMMWWGTAADGDEKLRIVARWKLDDILSDVQGFSYLPSPDRESTGNFYIHLASSIFVYSMPTDMSRPQRLKSLNMKVLGHGRNKNDGTDVSLTSMNTFEGITYIISQPNVLEAWNMTEGSLLSEIELPAITNNDKDEIPWAGLALERSSSTSTRTHNVCGGSDPTTISSHELILHLMGDDQVSSFRVLEDSKRPFTLPNCKCRTSTTEEY